jgi:hypothetical protein
MRRLHHRLQVIETKAQRAQPNLHFISMLRYPFSLAVGEEALNTWLHEQLICHCRPDCPGKRVALLLPAKCVSPEEWAATTKRRQANRGAADADTSGVITP